MKKPNLAEKFYKQESNVKKDSNAQEYFLVVIPRHCEIV